MIEESGAGAVEGRDGSSRVKALAVAVAAAATATATAASALDERSAVRSADSLCLMPVRPPPAGVAAALSFALHELSKDTGYSQQRLRDEINGGLLVQLKESIGQRGELMQDELDIVRLQSVLTYYVTVT